MTSVVVRHSIAAHKASSSNLRPCSYCAKIACSGGGEGRGGEGRGGEGRGGEGRGGEGRGGEGRGGEGREGEGMRTEIILFCKGVAPPHPLSQVLVSVHP